MPPPSSTEIHAPPATTTPIRDASPRTSPPRFLLATVHGAVQLHTLPASGEAVLGRGAECDVVLDFTEVSRQHARLKVGETCILTDLGSRNGTLLRGEQLRGEAREIAYGDSFSIGPASLLLIAPSAGAAAPELSRSRLRIDDVEADTATPLVSSIAKARLSVLIFGETGVGKELLAQTIHRLSGRTGAFVAINCAALTESLLESELFGHERGAFTGAVTAKPGLMVAASGGTLLLDELGEMAPASQAKLLRAIETQTVMPVGSVNPVPIDVRFVSATHRNLLSEVKQGSFRRDLYYRLAGFVLEVPPLRQRANQIPRLALQLLATVAAKYGIAPPPLTPEASVALQTHNWPGNIRELRNVLERAMLVAAGGCIEAGHLLFDNSGEPEAFQSEATASAAPVEDERAKIVRVLEACAGNQTHAARILVMSRTTLLQKLRLYGIPRPRSAR